MIWSPILHVSGPISGGLLQRDGCTLAGISCSIVVAQLLLHHSSRLVLLRDAVCVEDDDAEWTGVGTGTAFCLVRIIGIGSVNIIFLYSLLPQTWTLLRVKCIDA